jgi:hypothetical protein
LLLLLLLLIAINLKGNFTFKKTLWSKSNHQIINRSMGIWQKYLIDTLKNWWYIASEKN